MNDPLSPEQEVERAELRERVGAAIDRLPEREREALVLREFEELRYREIAEQLGIPIGTVIVAALPRPPIPGTRRSRPRGPGPAGRRGAPMPESTREGNGMPRVEERVRHLMMAEVDREISGEGRLELESALDADPDLPR